jgi:hypothetical protein
MKFELAAMETPHQGRSQAGVRVYKKVSEARLRANHITASKFLLTDARSIY